MRTVLLFAALALVLGGLSGCSDSKTTAAGPIDAMTTPIDSGADHPKGVGRVPKK